MILKSVIYDSSLSLVTLGIQDQSIFVQKKQKKSMFMNLIFDVNVIIVSITSRILEVFEKEIEFHFL